MKKFIVILVFATVPTLLIGCDEDEEKIAQLSELQEIDDVYVIPKTRKPYSGKFVAAYENDTIKEAGSLKDGKFHGEIKKYSENGHLIQAVNYKDGIIDYEIFTDSRDSKAYKTVKIGSQTWFAENLNYDANGSKCYENDPSNCQKYGRLYDWNTALTACPSGWHLPNRDESEALEDIVGGSDVAGEKLKAKSGWNGNGDGTDEFGFSALPGGYGDSDGGFYGAGDGGYWWSASEFNANIAYGRFMYCDNEDVDWDGSSKNRLFSIRCVR